MDPCKSGIIKPEYAHFYEKLPSSSRQKAIEVVEIKEESDEDDNEENNDEDAPSISFQ